MPKTIKSNIGGQREEHPSISLYRRGVIETGIVPSLDEIQRKSFFAEVYTPGVAEVVKKVKENPELAYELTTKKSLIAVVSDGTRVLGLGDVGPVAGTPVMMGKSFLFKYLGGVDAIPLCLDTKDPDEIIKTCEILQPSLAGINLEDIESPKCFYILDRLRESKKMDIPVWHDDQQGTATVVLAALINSLKLVRKHSKEVRIAMIGAGAANVAVARLLVKAGFPPQNMIMVDINGILNKSRVDLINDPRPGAYVYKQICETTNPEQRCGGIEEAMKGSDVVIGLSGPNIIEPEFIKSMKKNPIVFACANPIPEIHPDDAKNAGAAIVATGRSDFPNQVNNSLVFPAIFLGVILVRAKTITDGMCIAAANALARYQQNLGLKEDTILPKMSDGIEPFVAQAVAVAMKAIEQGVARIVETKENIEKEARARIQRVRELIKI